MSRNATPDQPVVRFATKRGRRTFLYFGSIAFVVCCFGMIVLGLYLIRQDPLAELRAWIILVIGMIGVPFFGLIAFGIGRNHWGRQGDTSLILTSEGLIDRTQIVGALPVVPWSLVQGYDLMQFHGQPFLMLHLADVDAYLKLIGSSRIMRWTFKANAKILRTPVHSIALQHVAASHEEILYALAYFTGLAPGQPRVTIN